MRFDPTTTTAIPYVYKGNYERIVESIVVAKQRGATLRVGPELEIPCVGRVVDRSLY